MMDELTMLYEQIDEEINDARDYAKDAMHFREKNPGMAQAYIKLSSDELQHAQVLQGLAMQQKKEHPSSEEARMLMEWIRACQDERMKDVVKTHEAYQKGR